jgi:hypothetical protein
VHGPRIGEHAISSPERRGIWATAGEEEWAA